MRQTIFCLTAAQREFLDVRAAAAGTTRSAALRDIIDAAAAQPITVDAEVRCALAEFADNYGDLAKRLSENDPELSIDPVGTEPG